MRQRNNNRNDNRNKPKHILNDSIRHRTVRLIGDDIESSVMDIESAREIAEQRELDLMLVTDRGNPPVVRLCNYQKFLYQEKKKKKDQEQKQKLSNKDLKEMRFSPTISSGDIDVKVSKITKFLEKGHKVKLDMRFKGRMIQHKEIGEKVLLNIAVDLEEISKPDNLPKLSGRSMIMVLSPKLKKK